MHQPLPVFAVNLPSRPDRRAHILSEFENRPEFALTIVDAVEDSNGAKGLWKSLCSICKQAIHSNLEFLIFCEDDHAFTGQYDRELFYRSLQVAIANEADILLGGVSWMNSFVEIGNGLAWLERFTGLQFAVIFKRSYSKIVESLFGQNDVADLLISKLLNKKFVLTPFISTQKAFGYSDVTPRNGQPGHLEDLFERSASRIQLARTLSQHFRTNKNSLFNSDDCLDIQIPVYPIKGAMNTSDQKPSSRHILPSPFVNANVANNLSSNSGMSKWKKLQSIVADALLKEEDAIGITVEENIFNAVTNPEEFRIAIIDAYLLGADMLAANVSDFSFMVSFNRKISWIASCKGAALFILYKPAYKKIMEEPENSEMEFYDLLSELCVNKFVAHPFWVAPSGNDHLMPASSQFIQQTIERIVHVTQNSNLHA